MAWIEDAAAIGRTESVAKSGLSSQQCVEKEDECQGGGECEEYGRGSVSRHLSLLSVPPFSSFKDC